MSDVSHFHLWKYHLKHNMSGRCLIKKMDQTGANFYFYVDTIIKILGSAPTVLNLPIRSIGEFLGSIDSVTI